MSIAFRAKTVQGWTVKSPLQPFLFPDGAAHIKGADHETVFEAQIADVRGLSHDDLFTLAMWADAVGYRAEKKVVILPYLPGARMDRGVPTGAFVYADFILGMIEPDQIITLDPHSEAALQFYLDHPTVDVSVFPVERIIRHEVQDPDQDTHANNIYQGVIAPDKGAHGRAAAAARVMGNLPVYTGGKTRDFNSGKITGFHMEDELPDEGRFLIVDDICDGGGTFLALAEATGLPKDRLDLWVTHGIFSKGFKDLRRHFGTIHTTDSYFAEDANGLIVGTNFTSDPDLVKVHRIGGYLETEVNV